jgi:hypothetical protein
MKFVVVHRAKRLFKQTLVFSLLLSLSVYGWARILFYEVPFTIEEDIPIIAKIIMLCWIMVLASGIVITMIFKIGQWIQQPSSLPSFNKKWIATLLAVVFISAFLFSCNV